MLEHAPSLAMAAHEAVDVETLPDMDTGMTLADLMGVQVVTLQH